MARPLTEWQQKVLDEATRLFDAGRDSVSAVVVARRLDADTESVRRVLNALTARGVLVSFFSRLFNETRYNRKEN